MGGSWSRREDCAQVCKGDRGALSVYCLYILLCVYATCLYCLYVCTVYIYVFLYLCLYECIVYKYTVVIFFIKHIILGVFLL